MKNLFSLCLVFLMAACNPQSEQANDDDSEILAAGCTGSAGNGVWVRFAA